MIDRHVATDIKELLDEAQARRAADWQRQKQIFEHLEEARRVLCAILAGADQHVDLRTDPSTWPDEWHTTVGFVVRFVDVIAQEANWCAIPPDDAAVQGEVDQMRPMLRLPIAEVCALPWIDRVRRAEFCLQCLLDEMNAECRRVHEITSPSLIGGEQCE